MSSRRQIFILGATGYIGGTVLQRLRQHRATASSEITALVRNVAKVPLFASIGIRTVVGNLDDEALLERQASKSDVVFACADANHIRSCEAILRGLRRRHEQTCAAPIFVHTVGRLEEKRNDINLFVGIGFQSGTFVLSDDAGGMYLSDVVWDDTDLDQLARIPHPRMTDSLVLAADKEGYARTHIVLPTNIYGLATSPLVDLGIQNPRSGQIPMFVKIAIARKHTGMVGRGLNVSPNVYIDDIGDLYMVLYDAILDGRAGHGREGMYFGENGESNFRTIAARISEVLAEFGVFQPDQLTPTPFDETDYERFRIKTIYGSNRRCRAKRARALGWKPTYTTEDMLQGIRDEVEWQLEHSKARA